MLDNDKTLAKMAFLPPQKSVFQIQFKYISCFIAIIFQIVLTFGKVH